MSDSEAEKVDDAAEPVTQRRSTAYHQFMASQHPSKPDMPKEGTKSEKWSKYNHDMKASFDELPSADAAAFQEAADAENANLDSPRESLSRRAMCVFGINLHNAEANVYQIRKKYAEDRGFMLAPVVEGCRLACHRVGGRFGR